MFNYSILLIILTVLSIYTHGFGTPGGWSPADLTSENVIEAGAFAVHNKYPHDNVVYTITSALQQVVAGIKYEMTINITQKPDNICDVHMMKILKKLDQSYLLLEDVSTGMRCQ